ncbi:MAG: alcohol dehydrogenase [Bacteroidetes bacterium]|nr:MAG: alcohol dehydrogenase [Bacteroidota bacterium]
MKAITLVKIGKSETAFELRDVGVPEVASDQVLIKVDAFGLNYADVMARNGLYEDAPPIPSVLGYEVVGTVDEVGSDVSSDLLGKRALAFTRFGGYAEYAVTDSQAVVLLGNDLSNGEAVALATQYGTAYHCAYEMINMFEGDHILIHAAAGGVGTALVQLAKRKGCIVYGTVGSDEKIEYIKGHGVDFPINYNKADFVEVIKKIRGKEKIDVIFDSVGGSNYGRSKKILAFGGRIVSYGVAVRSGRGNKIIASLKMVIGFGFMHPIMLLMRSQGAIGVNMLTIADHKPHVLTRCINEVLELIEAGELKPHVGGKYKADQIAEAHAFLESRKSMGKIVIEW